jgi:cell division protein FtsA
MTEPVYLAALDVGTAKTVLAVAAARAGHLHYVAAATAPSRGMRRGQVAELARVTESVRQTVEQVEEQIERPLKAVAVSLGGRLQAVQARGGLALGSRPREVTQEDIRRAIECARQTNLPDGLAVLHIFPQEFLLDASDGIRDPVGMFGSQLEVRVYLPMVPVVVMQNLVAAINRAGLMVSDVILTSLAAAESVLSADERDLGVCLADIGAGTTDLIVYGGGAVRHTATLPIGGEHFTADLAVGLRTSVAAAEIVKREHGQARAEMVTDAAPLMVEGLGGGEPQAVLPARVAEILEARARELLELIRTELQKTRLIRAIPAGLVLTGGGAKLRGLLGLAESVVGLPVRLGPPRQPEGIPEEFAGPEFAAVFGVLAYTARAQQSRRRARSLWSRLRYLLGRPEPFWVLGRKDER